MGGWRQLCVLVPLSSCSGEGAGRWGSCCWRPQARVGGQRVWEVGLLGSPSQVRGQDATGWLSGMRPVPGTSSWKTGLWGPGLVPCGGSGGSPYPSPTGTQAPPVRDWVSSPMGWGWQQLVRGPWELCLGQRGVVSAPKGAGEQGRGPRACVAGRGAARAPCGRLARLLPSRPRRSAPSSRTPASGGFVGWSRPLSQSLEGCGALWRLRETVTVSCTDSLFWLRGTWAPSSRTGPAGVPTPLQVQSLPRCTARAAPPLHRLSTPHQGGAGALAFGPPAPALGTCRSAL